MALFVVIFELAANNRINTKTGLTTDIYIRLILNSCHHNTKIGRKKNVIVSGTRVMHGHGFIKIK